MWGSKFSLDFRPHSHLTHSGFETKQRIRNLNCSWRRRWLAYIQIRYSSSTHLWELLAHCFRSPSPLKNGPEKNVLNYQQLGCALTLCCYLTDCMAQYWYQEAAELSYSTFGQTQDGRCRPSWSYLNRNNSTADYSTSLKIGKWLHYWATEVAGLLNCSLVHYGSRN